MDLQVSTFENALGVNGRLFDRQCVVFLNSVDRHGLYLSLCRFLTTAHCSDADVKCGTLMG